MTKSYAGGCACGAVRYEISAEPFAMFYCQCRQCQRDSGTGHGAHLAFPREAAKFGGKVGEWKMVGDGGMEKLRAFCPTCGSPVYMTFPGMPTHFGVSAASLDEPDRFKPQFVCWTAAGHAFDRIDPALPKFDKMPPRG
ncbi:MAG: GFA family protein [Proteobacteria bacterium]|nr:GFA family protein [Pseudomonadota bacterium]